WRSRAAAGTGPAAGWVGSGCRCATPAPPGVYEHLLDVAQGPAVGVGRVPGPLAVRAEVPGGGGVGHARLQAPVERTPVGGVGDPHQGLDAAFEVAVHHVRAADPHLRFAAVAEGEDAGVLQEAAEGGAAADAARQAGHARPDGADAAHPDVDRHARLGRAVAGVDDGLVDHRVDLDAHVRS